MLVWRPLKGKVGVNIVLGESRVCIVSIKIWKKSETCNIIIIIIQYKQAYTESSQAFTVNVRMSFGEYH